MNTSKRLLFLLMFGFCMLCLGGAANASDQICLDMASSPATGTHSILKLGIMDYGNGHIALAGTATDYAYGGSAVNYPGLVNGNAELIGDQVQVSLTGSMMVNGGIGVGPTWIAVMYSNHLWLDPATLNGTFVSVPSGSTSGIPNGSGTVTVVTCS